MSPLRYPGEPSAEVEPEDAGRAGELMQAMFKILMTVLSVLFVVLAFLQFEEGGPGTSEAAQMNSAFGLRAPADLSPRPALPAHDIALTSAEVRPATARRNVAVMAGPSLTTPVLARLLVGQEVMTAGRGVPGWEIVILPGGTGYVPAAAVAPEGPRAEEPVLINASLQNPG